MHIQPAAKWIAQAYDAWLGAMDEISGFSPEIDSSGATVTHVILLGLAQHGKTTLALRLLEATPADAIGEALRGGRLQGQSATPGPIGYFACDPGATFDAAAITRAVESIYDAYASAFKEAKAEAGQGKALLGLLPEIPIPSQNPVSPFKVVDMAGFDGRETWAEAAACYWTARADFSILVIQAEKISQLTGEDFKSVIAQFKNRWTHSDSMLVVTTGSFEQKPDPAEEGLGWEAIRCLRRNQFYRDALGDSAIPLDKIELFPMSLLPGDGRMEDPLTLESLARLKIRLSDDTLLRRLSNAKVLHRDRVEALKTKRTKLELERDRNGVRLGEVETADKAARDATVACAKFLRELPEIESVRYAVEKVDEKTWHDTYKVQEPLNAFQFHSNRLTEYQDALKGRLKKLHDKFNFFPLDEFLGCLQPRLHPTGLSANLCEPIADEDFKKEKWIWPLTHYDVAESGKALRREMMARERAMVAEVEHCGGLFQGRVAARAEAFSDQLEAFRKANALKLAKYRAQANKVEEAMKDLDRRQKALPPIPDLAASLKAAFTRAWNDLVAKANMTDMNSEALAELFLEQWALKETLGEVEARFGTTKS